MSTSVEEIKVLIDDYNDILEEYKTTNNALSGLGSYIVLSNKTISGGTIVEATAKSNVAACQARCKTKKCSYATYNSGNKECRIYKNVNYQNLNNASVSRSVIIDNKLYYLNKLNDLNKQLSNINNQIVQKINTSTQDETLIAAQNNELSQLKTQLDEDKVSLNEAMFSTTANSMDNTNMLDLEYVQQEEDLSTNSNYYIFLLSVLICILAIVVIISIQK